MFKVKIFGHYFWGKFEEATCQRKAKDQAEMTARGWREMELPFAPFPGLRISDATGFWAVVETVTWHKGEDRFEVICEPTFLENSGPDGIRDFSAFLEEEKEQGWQVSKPFLNN